MHENLLAARVPPRTPLGELTALPSPLASGEGAGCPLSKDPTPLPHLLPEIGGLAARNMMGCCIGRWRESSENR